MSADRIKPLRQTVAILGLGRFGGAVASSLQRLGHDVLGIDENPELVQEWSQQLTHVAQADTTNREALVQLGLKDIDCAVVAIGSDLEASMMTVLALEELGVREIWAKATSSRHGHILERIGADHVVYPEADMGERVAHMVTGKMIDYIAFDDGFAIAKTRAPEANIGQTLSESALRSRYGITVIGIKRNRADFLYAKADSILERGDILIISGPTPKVEQFAAIT